MKEEVKEVERKNIISKKQKENKRLKKYSVGVERN